ncbi:uncharacterized protein TNCV_4452521 [Trichonephila clavipes]|nr:uncharacterized protein TNCV_4452521 [Trichonephila clavipes]
MALRFSSSDTMMEGPTVPEKKNLLRRKVWTLFVTNEIDFSAIVDAKEEDIVEEIEVETCECQHFQSNPRDMAGRLKLNIVGFYDSMFEKPEMWEEGIELPGGLVKDVWGIVERYLTVE